MTNRRGFTLIELIVYIAIVSVILVSISYLMLEILGGQANSDARIEVNQNLRFISHSLQRDIASAQTVGSLTVDTVMLIFPSQNITYNFDSVNKKLTRQVGSGPVIDIHSDEIEVTGSFEDLSFLGRAKNVSINLVVSYKNPGDLPDFEASTAVNFSVELRNRR